MGLKLRSTFYLPTGYTTFSVENIVFSGFNVVSSGIQNIVLSAFLFIDRFVINSSQSICNSGQPFPIGLFTVAGYFYNPGMSMLVNQSVNSNAPMFYHYTLPVQLGRKININNF